MICMIRAMCEGFYPNNKGSMYPLRFPTAPVAKRVGKRTMRVGAMRMRCFFRLEYMVPRCLY